MSVFVCVCMYVFICTYVCMYVYMYVYMYVRNTRQKSVVLWAIVNVNTFL